MSGLADRRRNGGPVDLETFEAPWKRPTEVPSNELRPVFLSQGVAAHASGSAYLEVGDLKMLATVHGPQQLRGDFHMQAEVEVSVSITSFSGIGNKEDAERSLFDFIRSSITPAILLGEYPKSRIVIGLTVLSGTTGAPQTAAAVNAVTLALINAGIALHDMVTAVSVGLIGEDLFIDTNVPENTPGLRQLVAAYSVSTQKLASLLVTSQGSMPRTDLKALLDRAGTAAVQLREVFASYLVEDYAKAT